MRDKIKLVSTGKTKAGKLTGTFRVRKKNKKTMTEKIKMKCFDKRAFNAATGKVGAHVLFEETKL